MARDDDSSGSSGELAESQGGADAGSGTQIICAFHSEPGPGPCRFCIEAGSDSRNKAALAFDQSTKSYRIPGRVAWVDDCPHCASTDLRNYEPNDQHPTGYIWCGQCGVKSL